MVCSADCNANVFDIFAGVLQEDILALYMFLNNLDYEHWTSIEM